MADLTEDPGLQTCPDFASVGFAPIRSPAVTSRLGTDVEVAEMMRAAWKATNDAQKLV